MTYNYPQTQYQQVPQPAAYGGYRPTPQYYQWAQTANTSSQVRPVSSIDEVKAFPIDFDGSISYFTDVANKKIYTKQINMDGTPNINVYELKEPITMMTDQPTASFVTKQEFEAAILELKQMYDKLANVKSIVKEDAQLSAAQPTPQFDF